LKPFLLTCCSLVVAAVAGLARRLLAPALLWGVAVTGVLALTGGMAEGAGVPRVVALVALAAAFLSTGAYLATKRERQPDEAGLWAAAALWLALLGAAAFDLSDLARGPREGAFVWVAGIAVFFAIWVPYLRGRCAVLPHATAWTLAAAAALPYGVGWLFAFDLQRLHAAGPLAVAVLSATAGSAAAWFAVRRLPGSARAVVWTAAVALLVPVWIEAVPESVVMLGVPAIGAVLIVALLGVERVTWGSLLCERGLALLPLAAACAAAFAYLGDAIALLAYAGGVIGIGAWWLLVVRRLGPDVPAQVAAVEAAATRLRTGAIGGATLATAALCGFLVTGLAWNHSSAQMLAWLRAAGIADIKEMDVVVALLRDEYLWRDQPISRKEPTKLDSLLDGWALPEVDRWSDGLWGGRAEDRDREEAIGTGLLVAFEGRTATVVLAPEGSPAHAAGIRRGDRLVLKPEQQPAADETRPGRRSVMAIRFPLTITVASPDGKERLVELATQRLLERRVVRTATLEAGGQAVGYVALSRFDPFAEREFAEAMASFRTKGVRTLVVDLRYNPGGYLRSAAGIAGAIVGERGRGQVFATTHHNSRYRDRDSVVRFRVPIAAGAAPERVVVITSGASCSASELLVKGLEPYLPVATVGATTCGKPVGSTFFDSGLSTYSVITIAVRNARGEGGYFDGLPPTCVAPDDVTRELGDAGEASLREALRYIATGKCSPAPVRATDESGVVL
jgi:C-terminal processing protease CtpA/Prc